MKPAFPGAPPQVSPASSALEYQPDDCPTSGLEADHPGVGLLGGGMKIIHPAQLDPLVERRMGKTANINAGEASPKCYIGVGGNFLVAVGWPNRHQLGTRPFHSHENGIVEQHQRNRVAVLDGR